MSLLKNYKRILIITGKYKEKSQDVEGYYQDKDSYFIKRSGEEHKQIQLTKKSLIITFPNQADRLQNQFTGGEVTVAEVIKFVEYYNSLGVK